MGRISSRARVLRRLLWHRPGKLVTAVNALALAYFFVEQFAPPWLVEDTRLGANIPPLDFWQWLSVALVLLLAFVFEGAYRVIRSAEGQVSDPQPPVVPEPMDAHPRVVWTATPTMATAGAQPMTTEAITHAQMRKVLPGILACGEQIADDAQHRLDPDLTLLQAQRWLAYTPDFLRRCNWSYRVAFLDWAGGANSLKNTTPTSGEVIAGALDAPVMYVRGLLSQEDGNSANPERSKPRQWRPQGPGWKQ